MQLGNGEYLIISSCIKAPYDSSKINGLIEEIKAMHAIFGVVNLLNIHPKKVNYHLVWEGIDDFSTSFSLDLLNQCVLSTLELRFNNGIPARLQVMFLDELSYEVSLIFNYTQLIDEENDNHVRTMRLEFIEKMALVCFEKLNPLYGTYGVERGVEAIGSLIKNASGLPCDKVFYNKTLINKSITLSELISGAKFSKKCNEGVYFRNSDLDDFQLVENEEQRMKLNELLKSF